MIKLMDLAFVQTWRAACTEDLGQMIYKMGWEWKSGLTDHVTSVNSFGALSMDMESLLLLKGAFMKEISIKIALMAMVSNSLTR